MTTKLGRPPNDPGISWNPEALLIRRTLHRPRMSTREVGEACGVGASTVSRWEHGQSPSKEHVAALCKLFKCRPRAFAAKIEVPKR